MKKLFLTLLLIACMAMPCYAANDWRNISDDFFDGDTTLYNDIDTELDDYLIEPIDRMLAGYRAGAIISYTTAASLTVSAGELMMSNVGGTIRKMRRNTSASTIDTTSASSSTTYYIWAIADADATTFTLDFTLSSTSPGTETYYRRIGSFYNNSDGNIAYISNFDGNAYEESAPSDTSEGTSYSAGTTYQNTTSHKLLIVVYGDATLTSSWYNLGMTGAIGETAAGTTVASYSTTIGSAVYGAGTRYGSITFVVPEGYFWKVTNDTVNTGTGAIDKIEAWEVD